MEHTASPLAPILGMAAAFTAALLLAGVIELGRRLIRRPPSRDDLADAVDRARWWLAQFDPAVYLRQDYADARRRASLTMAAMPAHLGALAGIGLERTYGRLPDGVTVELDTTPLLAGLVTTELTVDELDAIRDRFTGRPASKFGPVLLAPSWSIEQRAGEDIEVEGELDDIVRWMGDR